MFKFDERIAAIRRQVDLTWYGNIELLTSMVDLLDELNAEYKRSWVEECNTQGALEIQAERIAALMVGRQDSFDSDPNNKD